MRKLPGYAVKVILFFVTCKVVYLMYYQNMFMNESLTTRSILEVFGDEDDEFLINTSGCRIKKLDAYSTEIVPFVYKVKKISCTDKPLLTYIRRNNRVFTLHVNESTLDYSYFDVKCCYRDVNRGQKGQNIDDSISFTECRSFDKAVNITAEVIKVECSTIFSQVYENVHYIMRPPERQTSNTDSPNVILIGIDGVSGSNLLRTMPKTRQFCESHGWVSLKGYNKIEDNTYPNMIAVLAGVKYTYGDSARCDPEDEERFQSCDFIWDRYKTQNYSTAYAEDTPSIGTFNLNKVGFTDPPTDYYFRPYFLATDHLFPKYLCLRRHCTGPEKTGVRMQNLISDFLSSTRNSTPGFGLFWMNTFSHEGVNCPSSMDDDFADFFERLSTDSQLDDTIVVFFSDHGFRFGKIRLTHAGWMEERLPFIYIHIPERFRRAHVEEYENLLDNSRKLTSPYDLHMTLQHILSLSDPDFTETQAEGCPDCRSLFKNISSARTCGQAGIPEHYCTCSLYVEIDKKLPLVKDTARFFVDDLNERVMSFGSESGGCAKYTLQRVTHSQSLVLKPGKEENILISVVTDPEANFEATVKVFHGQVMQYSVLNINRLDRYGPKTICAKNSPVQIYCYCKSILKRLTNIFCNNKFCFLYLPVSLNTSILFPQGKTCMHFMVYW